MYSQYFLLDTQACMHLTFPCACMHQGPGPEPKEELAAAKASLDAAVAACIAGQQTLEEARAAIAQVVCYSACLTAAPPTLADP
jgi:hypothetical protein